MPGTAGEGPEHEEVERTSSQGIGARFMLPLDGVGRKKFTSGA